MQFIAFPTILLAIASLSSLSSAALTIIEGRKRFNMSPTLVEYETTMTSTSYHACGTHNSIVHRPMMFGHGPMRLIRTTITAHAITVTEHACAPTVLSEAMKAPQSIPIQQNSNASNGSANGKGRSAGDAVRQNRGNFLFPIYAA